MKLSLVMPLYNKAGHLEGTLRALLEQTRRPDELIVVDDASSDGSLALAERFLAEQGGGLPVAWLPLPRNGGPGNARNQGMALAAGDYVQFLDADDRLYPGCLERVSAVLAEHRPDFLILCYRRSGDGVDRPTVPTLLPLLESVAQGLYRVPRPVAAMASDGMGIIGSNLVCRRERLVEQAYDTQAKHFEGVDFWHRCFTAEPPPQVLLLGETCMDYLELPDGLLSRKALRAGEITVPALLRRLPSAPPPDCHALRRRLARVWLGNAWERLPNAWQRLAFLWQRRAWVLRTLWWMLTPPRSGV